MLMYRSDTLVIHQKAAVGMSGTQYRSIRESVPFSGLLKNRQSFARRRR